MNTAFDLEVQAHCPNAKIVYDLIHVLVKSGREVMDRVKVEQANKLKRSRWVLLKNRGNLNAQQDSYLTEILNINQDLMTTYILGAHLKELWYCESEERVRGLWGAWYEQVQDERVRTKTESLSSRYCRIGKFSAPARWNGLGPGLTGLVDKFDVEAASIGTCIFSGTKCRRRASS